MSILRLGVAYAVREEVGFEALVEAPLEKVLDMLTELGFSGIELNIANPMKFDVKRYRKAIEDRGLQVPVISTGLSYLTYGYSLTHSDSEMRRRSIEFFTKYAEIAHEFGCDRVVIGLARGRGDNPHALDMLKDSIAKILETTEALGTILLLEPLNRYETKLINKVSQFIEFVKSMGYPQRIRMLFDTFHMALEERDPYTALLQSKNYIGYVHLADSNRLAPGMGMIDWLKVIAILKAIGYNYFVTVEAIPHPSFEDMIRVASTTLRPIIEMFT